MDDDRQIQLHYPSGSSTSLRIGKTERPPAKINFRKSEGSATKTGFEFSPWQAATASLGPCEGRRRRGGGGGEGVY